MDSKNRKQDWLLDIIKSKMIIPLKSVSISFWIADIHELGCMSVVEKNDKNIVADFF